VNSETLSILAISLGAVGLLLGLISLIQVSKLRKHFIIFRGEANESDILNSILEHINRVNTLEMTLSKINNAVLLAQRDVAVALRHVAVVRFSAIQDMGGQYSFSMALLDDDGTGFVLTCIQNQTTSRVYAKPVLQRTSDIPLSPEELQAINSAKPLGSA
jgi:hypothetical protein